MHELICLLLLSSLPLNASDFALGSVRAGDIPAATAPAAAPAQPKEWTIIALLNGKNNLSQDALKDLNEMETTGSTAAIDIVVELGTAEYKEGKPPAYGVERYHVRKDGDINKVGSRKLAPPKGTDMGSWRHFAEFISWAKANYPAKRYMVVVWNHGSGWKSFGKPVAGETGEKGVSYDDETGNHITAVEMRAALAQAGGADFFASDACLMQELAANFEIREYAGVIAGSEETEPNEGQDYTAFLAALAAKPGAGAEEVSRMYVEAYRAYYTRAGKETTISAVRAASFDGLAAKVTALADALLAGGDMKFAKDSRRATVKFADPDARDLGHFAKIVAATSADPSIRAAAADLAGYISSEVVIANAVTLRRQKSPAAGTRGKSYEPASARDFSNATGLAAYIPVVYLPEDNYDQLSFARESSWTALIKKMRSVESDDDYWDDYPED